MAETPSQMVELGTEAPDFTLHDPVNNENRSLNELKSGKGTLIMFICNHCPYVKHINTGLVEFAKDYMPKGLSIVAINSNDAENYPEDSPKKMKEYAERLGYPFPYLFDESQEVAKAYDAACTPDFFLYDGDLKLVYRGQFDDSRPGNNKPVTGNDLRAAADKLLSGKEIDIDQIPSVGCNIKWKR